MSGLILHGSTTSPFVRMAAVVLRELKLEGEATEVAISTTPLATDPRLAGRNPLGKIPTLERPEGAALYDCRVICRYLDDRAGGRLYPGKPRLWDTLVLEATGHGIADAAVLMVYEGRLRAEEARSAAWVEAQWGKVARALDALEERWMAHLAGPLDAGQIAVGCALGYLDFRHGARGWRQGRPALTAWEARFAERPAMAATRPQA